MWMWQKWAKNGKLMQKECKECAIKMLDIKKKIIS